MQSAGNVSSEDFFEDFMLYSSVEVIMMKLEKRSPIASKNERSAASPGTHFRAGP